MGACAVVLAYTPHWAPIKFEGEWVEFPPYEDACYEDPAWGENPDMAYDCGKPRGWIKKVGWQEGEAKWPCAYEAIRNFTIDNETMGGLIAAIDLEGRDLGTLHHPAAAEHPDSRFDLGLADDRPRWGNELWVRPSHGASSCVRWCSGGGSGCDTSPLRIRPRPTRPPEMR